MRKTLRHLLLNTLCVCVASTITVFAPAPLAATEKHRADVGEAYIFNPVVVEQSSSAPAKAQQLSLGAHALSVEELLDPTSHTWAGAQGLMLRLEGETTQLASNVIASAGDGQAAAASHPDGRIQTFGLGNCTSLTLPGGHPAYALALSRDGGVLAAWAQGVQQFVYFDLRTPGCPATTVKSSLHGHLSMTLSSSGAFLAVQDSAGNVWIDPRGGHSNSTEVNDGRLRLIATLPGAPAAIGFSEGEGVLLVLDAQGRGGSWNPRTGKALRQFEVPGGPFARGEFSGVEARLWTFAGHMVRWDALHNTTVTSETLPQSPETPRATGWLELRGTDLYHVRQNKSWQPRPIYAPQLPQLTYSKHAACLRLADMDAVVRYFDARTGFAQSQCLADDWALVALQPDGTAQIPGLRLRIFETHANLDANAKSGSKLNSRAISETQAYLWADHQPELYMRITATPLATTSMLQKVAQASGKNETETLIITLRQGIAAEAPTTPLRVK